MLGVPQSSSQVDVASYLELLSYKATLSRVVNPRQAYHASVHWHVSTEPCSGEKDECQQAPHMMCLPKALNEMFELYVPNRELRSSDGLMIHLSCTNKRFHALFMLCS